jgi:hypothetical protein
MALSEEDQRSVDDELAAIQGAARRRSAVRALAWWLALAAFLGVAGPLFGLLFAVFDTKHLDPLTGRIVLFGILACAAAAARFVYHRVGRHHLRDD